MIIVMIIVMMIIIMMIIIIIIIVLILIEMYRIEELLFKNKLVTDRQSKYLGYVYIDCNVQSGHIFIVNGRTNELDSQTRSGDQKSANNQSADDTGKPD